jgi:IMP cyclohydrolase
MSESLRPEQIKGIARENFERLRSIDYIGRGFVSGVNSDGDLGVQVYWLEGRSEGSRNRMFRRNGDQVRTQAFEPGKLKDPRLVIYTAMDILGDAHIVSNGDQTVTIKDHLTKGQTFQSALRTRSFEPDRPIYTPRISASSIFKGNASFHQFSIIYKGVNEAPVRQFYHPDAINGVGNALHTYEHGGEVPPSFKGPPFFLPLTGNIDEILQDYWRMLNLETRVALVVKTVDRRRSNVDYRTIDIHHQGARHLGL